MEDINNMNGISQPITNNAIANSMPVPNITVIDSIMGSGKTSWAIEYMKKKPTNNFLYITPFLDECSRISEACLPEKGFMQPHNYGSGKLKNINLLFQNEQDIVSTHELFKHLNEESRRALKDKHYTLILDEVLDVIEPIPIKNSDLKILIDVFFDIDKNGVVHWKPEHSDYDGAFNQIQGIAESNSLVCINDSNLLWRYDPAIFSLFDEVFVMTYFFDGSIMKYYFDAYNIKYRKASVIDGKLFGYTPEDKIKIRSLINLYQGKITRSMRQKQTCMSKAWYANSANKNNILKVKNNLYNYLRNICHAKSESVLWTTYIDSKNKITPKGYKKKFLPFNCRSTNKYKDAYNLAYAVNIYFHPTVLIFLCSQGVKVNQDKYALATMLQWVWRSRIRNGESINLYILPDRMRNLFIKWMNNPDSSLE